jgi:hypothetical protein
MSPRVSPRPAAAAELGELQNIGLRKFDVARSSARRRQYASRFPRDKTMTDLDRWHDLESDKSADFCRDVPILGATDLTATSGNAGGDAGLRRAARSPLTLMTDEL